MLPEGYMRAVYPREFPVRPRSLVFTSSFCAHAITLLAGPPWTLHGLTRTPCVCVLS